MKHLPAITSLPAVLAAFALAAVALGPASASAQNNSHRISRVERHQDRPGATSSAQDRVNDSVRIIDQMKRDPNLASLLERAHGVFIVPHYGKGGFIVGGQGGGGVVLAHRHGTWSSPAFFSIAGGSIGAQAGGEGGSIAMLLMTRKAVDKFENSKSAWSLNGNAGLTVVTWSRKAQAETGNGDVIVWANTSGLYGGLTASVTDVTPDRKMDHSYYGRNLDARQILEGNVLSAHAEPLRNALLTRVASK
jgi:lipid-binding SYLF domain-containing protein